MARSTFFALALAALWTAQLLQAHAAQVLGEECVPGSVKGSPGHESCIPTPARGTDLIQTTKKALSFAQQHQSGSKQNQSSAESTAEGSAASGSHRRRRHDYRTGDRTGVIGFDDLPPPDETPDCTAESGTTTCMCRDRFDCVIEEMQGSNPMYAMCADRVVWTDNGGLVNSPYRAIRYIISDVIYVYCRKMVKVDEWSTPHHIKRWRSDKRWSEPWPQWKCRANFNTRYWEGGQCKRKVRYLDEICERDNQCAGNNKNGKYKTKCVRQGGHGECKAIGALPLEPCDCAPNVPLYTVACTSHPDSPCKGHACLLDPQSHAHPVNPNRRMFCDMTQPDYDQ